MTGLLLTLDSLQTHHPLVFFWIDVLAKTSLILGLGLLWTVLARKQSAATLSLIWLAALIASLAVPLLKWLLPVRSVTVDLPQGELTASGNLPDPTAADSGAFLFAQPALLISLGLVYAGVAISLALYLLAGVVRLACLSARAQPLKEGPLHAALLRLMQVNGMDSTVSLRVNDQVATPFTWGLFRHFLIVPREALCWPEDLVHQALSHELGHVQRNDWICRLLGKFARCFLWPNPLAWIAVRALHLESEKACDDAAVDCTGNGIDYASNLLRLVGRTPAVVPVTAAGLFGKSSLYQRIRHILCPHKPRGFLRSDEILLAVVFALILTTPLALLGLSAQAGEMPASVRTLLPLVYDPVADGSTAARFDATDIRVTPRPEQPPFSTARFEPPWGDRAPVIARTAIDNGTLPEQPEFVLTEEPLFERWEAAPLQVVLPEYPLRARNRGIEGYAVAEYRINENGQVFDSRIIESVPTGTFDNAVLRALDKFVYCPEVVDGIGGNNQPVRKRFSFYLYEEK